MSGASVARWHIAATRTPCDVPGCTQHSIAPRQPVYSGGGVNACMFCVVRSPLPLAGLFRTAEIDRQARAGRHDLSAGDAYRDESRYIAASVREAAK